MKHHKDRSERFRSARTRLNESTREVAKAIGVAPSMVSDMETSIGDRNINYKNAAAFARHYGVDLVWLMEGEEPQEHSAPAFATAAEYTNLSPKAIEHLHRIADKGLSKVASAVLESNLLEYLLTAMQDTIQAAKKAEEARHKSSKGEYKEIKERVEQESNGWLSVIDVNDLPATYQRIAESRFSQIISELCEQVKKPITQEEYDAISNDFVANADPYGIRNHPSQNTESEG